MELVRCRCELDADVLGQNVGDSLVESLWGIESCSDCCSANCQLGKLRNVVLNELAILFKTCTPSADFLCECDRGGIHKMSSPAFENALILLLKLAKCCNEYIKTGQYLLYNELGGRYVQCCWEGVIGTLTHVHIIIRMKELCSSDFITPVCHHFVDIHVCLCAASCLPYHQREVPLQLAIQYVVASLHNGFFLFLGHLGLESPVCLCRSTLKMCKSRDDLLRHCLMTDSDREVLLAPLCLGSPVSIHRYLDLTHAVVFSSCLH